MDRVYITSLFDLYKSLLTERELSVFSNYYEQDLSMGEIADNDSVSRSAVFNTLKIAEDKLNEYEEKLGLYKLYQKLEEINRMDDVEDIKSSIRKILGD